MLDSPYQYFEATHTHTQYVFLCTHLCTKWSLGKKTSYLFMDCFFKFDLAFLSLVRVYINYK